MKFYTIAVQRWPLPWMTRFRAVDHFWSTDELKLTVVDHDGNARSFPRMDRRRVTVFADYRTFQLDLKPITKAEMFHVKQPAPEELSGAGLLTPEEIVEIQAMRNGFDNTEAQQHG